MRAEPATTMGSSCLSDCIRIHKQGLITHHVTNKTLNRIRSSPVGSIGTSSSSTDYEDISPCPSPCSHYETHMPAFPYMTQAISFETSIQKANQNICSNHACAMYHDEISISASQQHDEHTQLEDKNRVIYRKRSVTEHFTDYNNWITLIFKKIGKNDKSNCLPCQELCMSLHCKSKSTRNSVSSNNKTDS